MIDTVLVGMVAVLTVAASVAWARWQNHMPPCQRLTLRTISRTRLSRPDEKYISGLVRASYAFRCAAAMMPLHLPGTDWTYGDDSNSWSRPWTWIVHRPPIWT